MRYVILFLICVVFLNMTLFAAPTQNKIPSKIRAASMNLCEEGPQRGSHGAKNWAKILKDSQADVIALQEIYDFKKDKSGKPFRDKTLFLSLVKELGWTKVWEDGVSATAIVTRLKTQGDQIILPNGQTLKALSVHLTDTPYQICQIYPCEYYNSPKLSSLDEVFRSAKDTRTKDLKLWLEKNQVDPSPRVLIMGDLNEPSHLDWTPRALAKGLYKFAMKWPTSHLLTLVGFDDTYRKIHTDEVAKPGHTYPAPKWPEKFGISTRIDYIFSKGMKTLASGTFDTLEDWPSDHLGVWADFQL